MPISSIIIIIIIINIIMRGVDGIFSGRGLVVPGPRKKNL